jgi:hypothetical protein
MFPVKDYTVFFLHDGQKKRIDVKAINDFAAGCKIRVDYPGAEVHRVQEVFNAAAFLEKMFGQWK